MIGEAIVEAERRGRLAAYAAVLEAFKDTIGYEDEMPYFVGRVNELIEKEKK